MATYIPAVHTCRVDTSVNNFVSISYFTSHNSEVAVLSAGDPTVVN